MQIRSVLTAITMLTVSVTAFADLEPFKDYEVSDAFMKEFGEVRSKETTEYAQKNYPAMRELTGQYLLREITLK